MTISTLGNDSGKRSAGSKNGATDLTYGKKCFTREEWKEQVAKYSAMGELYANKTIHYPLKIQPNSIGGAEGEGFSTIQTTPIEPTLPRLLLNYFVSMAYEDSSVRMAKELGFIRNNKDIALFNDLYKIKERFHIKRLIKLGHINKAMDEINSIFGLEVLEETFNATRNDADRTEKQQQQQQFDIDGDLHFKLLLLNLIEMIRNHHQQKDVSGDSNDFILNLIEYSQKKLAVKASSNIKKMQELELAMTLLLFPLSDATIDNDSIKLPKSLQNLYSISLRSKIANLVNEKLLKFIHPKIQFEISHNNSKFSDLLNSDKKIITQNFTVYNNDLVNGSNGTKINHISSDQPINEKMASNEAASAGNPVWLKQRDGNVDTSSTATIFQNLENKNYWNQTSELLTSSDAKTKDSQQFNNYYSSEFPYEPRLTQIMKLWSWCENQLHHNQIGVPRVEN